MPPATFPPPSTLASSAGSIKPEGLEQALLRSRTFARILIVGLPGLGLATMLIAGLPLFASLMAACFLLATALTGRKALAAFTGRTLRLLVTARLVVALVLGALLFCAHGSAWVAVVSAVLLWLATDRLLGRHALTDLRKLVRGRR